MSKKAQSVSSGRFKSPDIDPVNEGKKTLDKEVRLASLVYEGKKKRGNWRAVSNEEETAGIPHADEESHTSKEGSQWGQNLSEVRASKKIGYRGQNQEWFRFRGSQGYSQHLGGSLLLC